MISQSTPQEAAVNTHMQSTGGTGLHGHWLLLARVVWMAMFVLTLVVFCANHLAGDYGLLTTILLAAVTGVWFAMSLVLFWRKSSDPFILLLSLGLIVMGGVFIQPFPTALFQWNWAWAFPYSFLEFLAGATLILGFTFPDGHFVPRWTRWLALGWIAITLVTNLPVSTPGAFYPWNWWSSPLFTLVQIAFYGSLALALLYRYRRVSTPIQRQQIKWVVFAATIVLGEAMAANLVVFVVPSYFPALALSAQFHQLILLVSYLLPVLLPLSIGIALLRYRLWDIDVIINRALVYGSLTALLALLYFGLIFGLQTLFQGMVHQNNAVTIVVSTLAIAALFQPLRHHLQKFIDRRFYRSKYDATKTLAAFSARLRNEVDLDELNRHLVAIVEETMQPTHVSLWLRPPQQDGKLQAPWRANPPLFSEDT